MQTKPKVRFRSINVWSTNDSPHIHTERWYGGRNDDHFQTAQCRRRGTRWEAGCSFHRTSRRKQWGRNHVNCRSFSERTTSSSSLRSTTLSLSAVLLSAYTQLIKQQPMSTARRPAKSTTEKVPRPDVTRVWGLKRTDCWGHAHPVTSMPALNS